MKLAVAALAVLALVGCSSNESPTAESTPSTEVTSSAPSTSASQPVPSTKPVEKNAGEVATAMKASLPNVKSVTVWTAETDSNKLLGRPGQYTSAATLVDKSLPCSDVGVDCGASIEVFETEQAAQERKTYIQSVRKGGILGTEYDTVIGVTLLRVTGELTPAANKTYVAAFTNATKG